MDKLDLVGRGNQFRIQMFVDLLFSELLRLEQTNHMLHLCLSIYIDRIYPLALFQGTLYSISCNIFYTHFFIAEALSLSTKSDFIVLFSFSFFKLSYCAFNCIV